MPVESTSDEARKYLPRVSYVAWNLPSLNLLRPDKTPEHAPRSPGPAQPLARSHIAIALPNLPSHLVSSLGTDGRINSSKSFGT